MKGECGIEFSALQRSILLPMAYDDDEIELSLSSRRALERSDHGKQEKKEQLRTVKQKQELARLKREMLRKQVDRKDAAFKTQTHKEEEESRVQEADTKPTPDRLVSQDREQKKTDAQRQYEEAQDEPG